MGSRRGIGLAVVLALSSFGCDRADYSDAGFPPPEKPDTASTVYLVAFRPEGRGVAWGDAALQHRSSPAELGAVPVPYRVSLDGGPFRPSDSEGVWTWRLGAGPHGLRVEFGSRELLRRFELGEGRLRVELWSVEKGGEVLGIGGTYPRSELTAWPVEELAEDLRRLRRLRWSLGRAFEEGDGATLEELFTEDFRDPLGGRTDLVRAAVHAARQGEPWKVVEDAWMDVAGTRRLVHLVVERDGGRLLPTLDLAPGDGDGYRIRTWL
jgi:hypothetical protein